MNEIFRLFENSLKRQAMFERILENSEYDGTKTRVQGLFKTPWVKRHDCYETFHELFLSVTTTLEVTLRPHNFVGIIGNDNRSCGPDKKT